MSYLLLTAVFGLLFMYVLVFHANLDDDVVLIFLGLAVLGGCIWVFSHGAMKKS